MVPISPAVLGHRQEGPRGHAVGQGQDLEDRRLAAPHTEEPGEPRAGRMGGGACGVRQCRLRCHGAALDGHGGGTQEARLVGDLPGKDACGSGGAGHGAAGSDVPAAAVGGPEKGIQEEGLAVLRGHGRDRGGRWVRPEAAEGKQQRLSSAVLLRLRRDVLRRVQVAAAGGPGPGGRPQED